MNRRTLFKSIIKQNSQNGANHVAEFRNENLDEYTGPWTEKEAAHLLRRTMFGPSLQNIQDAVNLGLAGTIALLTDESNIPQTTPIHPGKTEVNGNLITVADPNIDIGKPPPSAASMFQMLPLDNDEAKPAVRFSMFVTSVPSVTDTAAKAP